MNFYDRWLNAEADWKEQSGRARKAIQEEELEWMRTKQDFRTALLCSRENGFLTTGDIMLAEIPPRWQTGRHSHGEEAIYIVRGKGCSVVDGLRYDWEDDSCLFIPFGSVHQHFNRGDVPVRYFSVMAIALEMFSGIAKVVQYEEVAESHLHVLDGVPAAESDIHPELGRIIMRAQDAPVVEGEEWGEVWSRQTDEYSKTVAEEMRTPGAQAHRSRMVRLMRWKDSQFKAREVEISAIMYDKAGSHSGKHAHMEAILYTLEGEGYSIVDGQRVPWKAGTLTHVPGPQTIHQHFNTGAVDARHIRVNYALRSQLFQPIATRVWPYLYYEFSNYNFST